MKLIKYLLLTFPLVFACSKKGPEMVDPVQEQPKEFKFWSTAFQNDSFIPVKFTCDASEKVSPELKWENPPAGTKSFLLIMDDPDAPGDTFVHWIVYGIPANVTTLEEKQPHSETLPNGAFHGENSGLSNSYMQPCPPSGVHRYFFNFYALDTTFGIGNGRTKEYFTKAIQGHILKQAQIIGKYQR